MALRLRPVRALFMDSELKLEQIHQMKIPRYHLYPLRVLDILKTFGYITSDLMITLTLHNEGLNRYRELLRVKLQLIFSPLILIVTSDVHVNFSRPLRLD